MPRRRFDRVLVIGGTGFLGRHLVKALLPQSSDVIVASRAAAPQEAGVKSLAVDLAKPASAYDLVREVRPTTVFYLAGVRPQTPDGNPRGTAEINLIAPAEVLRASSERNVERIVLLGSAEEYGDQPCPTDEDAPLCPTTAYGASKAAMSIHALTLHRATQTPVVIMRPFSVYGAGAPRTMFIAEAMDCAARGLPFSMTHGAQRRDFVYVDDIVDGLVAGASVREAVGQAFNLGTGISHSLRDVAHQIWAISGTRAALKMGTKAPAMGDLAETRADNRRARLTLGWQPRVSLSEGLRRTWLAASSSSQAPPTCQ